MDSLWGAPNLLGAVGHNSQTIQMRPARQPGGNQGLLVGSILLGFLLNSRSTAPRPHVQMGSRPGMPCSWILRGAVKV